MAVCGDWRLKGKNVKILAIGGILSSNSDFDEDLAFARDRDRYILDLDMTFFIGDYDGFHVRFNDSDDRSGDSDIESWTLTV
jgi:hypothetical protein